MLIQPATGFKLLAVATPAAVAAVDFTLTAQFDEYELHFQSLLPAIGSDLMLRVSNDGGATFNAGVSDYAWAIITNSSPTAAPAGASSGAMVDRINIFGAAVPLSATGAGANGVIRLIRPIGAAAKKLIITRAAYYSGGLINVAGAGLVNAPEADYNAVRLAFASGNIASGTLKLYGVGK